MTFKSVFENQLDQIFNSKKYWIHIGIWALSIGIVLYYINTFTYDKHISVDISNLGNNIKTDVIIKGSIIGFIIAAFVVYSILLFFIPLARYKKKARYFIGSFAIFSFIGFVAFIIYAYNMAMRFKEYGNNLETDFYKIEAANEIILLLLIFIFPLIVINLFFQIYYFINLYEQQYYIKKYQSVIEVKTVAELRFLKSQINPHFLFNSLNNIYSLSLSNTEKANVTAKKLKNLFMYVVNDSKKELVSIDDEIQFLKDYIDLESVRNKQDTLDIQFKVFGDTHNKFIAPLILINFFENAFKHGVKSQIDNSYIHATIDIVDNSLSFNLINSITNVKELRNSTVQNVGGIGLRNIKRRLEILYPNQHRLHIQQKNNEFSIQLNLIL